MAPVSCFLLLLVSYALSAADSVDPTPDQDGLVHEQLAIGGLERTWLRFWPRYHDRSRPCPLIIALHGGDGKASGMAKLTEHGFERQAESAREDVVVVYPDAFEKHWHDDREGLDTSAVKHRIDDVAFIRALIRQQSQETAIDVHAIFATGISNGAMMCFRLAREAPEIAAIAPVAGLIPAESEHLAWPRPVSVLLIQGTADPLMPAQGGAVGTRRMPLGEVLSLAATERWLVQNDDLTRGVMHEQDLARPDADADADADPTTAHLRSHRSGATAVQVLTIDGGGHTWPGGYQYLPEFLIGRTCRSLDACAMIWAFFQAHHQAP